MNDEPTEKHNEDFYLLHVIYTYGLSEKVKESINNHYKPEDIFTIEKLNEWFERNQNKQGIT